MSISIIVISWNSLPMLRRCLESLTDIVSRNSAELIWVDNGSNDNAKDYIANKFPNAKRIILPENKGVAYARNVGVRESVGDYILFLDDDTEASTKAIDSMTEFLSSHKNVGIAACSLRDFEGNLQPSFKSYPGLICKVRNAIASAFNLKDNVDLPARELYPTYVIGACQLIKRDVFDTIGLLDENIFYGPEDADFCIRAKEHGYDTVFLPDISILHHWRRISSRSLFSKISLLHIKALIYFWRKHHRLWS
ncbi:MAG: glycosyltransferase family 2 protein [Clostridium sp.]|nr:glycosyltransferase family 2 protein [Clostridium sp.]